MSNEARFPGDGFTGVATAALTAKQYYLAQHVSGTDRGVTFATAVTEKPAGVIMNAPASGGAVDVKSFGLVKVKLGGTVAVGDRLTATTDGSAVAAAPSAGVNNAIWGIATIAGASGDIGEMIACPGIMQGA